jgi:hypothetical protein
MLMINTCLFCSCLHLSYYLFVYLFLNSSTGEQARKLTLITLITLIDLFLNSLAAGQN